MHPQDGRGSESVVSALNCLTVLFRFHGAVLDREAVAHELAGQGGVTPDDIIRHVRRQGLRARRIQSAPERLAVVPLPALALNKDGTYFLLAKAGDGKALVQSQNMRPELLTFEALAERWSGTLVLVTRRASLGNLARRFDLRWFLQSFFKYRWILGEVLIGSFFLQVFALISPIFFQVVVDKVLGHRGISTLDVLVVGLVMVSFFESALATLRTYIFSHTTNRIDVELGARLFRHLLSLPLAYFGARRVGDSVARVRELENIRQFLTSSALTLVIDLLFTFVFLAVMAWYSWVLTLVVIVSLPVYVAISAAVSPIFRERLNEKFRRGAENQALLVEVVTGVETLKSMAAEPQMQRRWEEQLASYVSASFAVTSLANYASQSIQFVSKVVTAAILFWGAHAVMNGDMTVGELVAFNMLAGRVAQPVLRLAQIWQDFHQARLSVDRLGDILNTAPETGSGARAALPPIKGHISLQRLSFRYRLDGAEILKDISLDVPAGQVLGIVGSSGSGKSTIAKIVQRLYVPESGRVLIDGVDLALADSGWLRRQIGVVQQESMLFNRSVRDNIALTDPGAPIERVIAAAKLAGAHDFILALPEGYDTVIGERGGSLSGGQRQRIAIARALMRDPRILIFDEATSALDYESEHAIQRNMRQICAGRTVIVIAHRLSTIRSCDRIVAVEQGRVVEDGSHDELLRRDGRYASLHNLQGGFTDAA
jgi:subfamily B ATP-binding cassette protein HlyB/CyaB